MNELQIQKAASTHLSVERVEHREWIGGRALTLLSHYWRDDDPVELTAAIGGDWADVLEGLPQDCIQKACIEYQRRESRRKPTPGAIYRLARTHMPAPVVVSEPEPPREPRLTAERQREIVREVFPDEVPDSLVGFVK